MRFEYERLVKPDGTVQLPQRLAGKVVLVVELQQDRDVGDRGDEAWRFHQHDEEVP